MNTDSYSEFLSEEQMNIAVNQALALNKHINDDLCRSDVSKILHEVFCPCLLSSCPACDCKYLNEHPVSNMENMLITEITTRVHHIWDANNIPDLKHIFDLIRA